MYFPPLYPSSEDVASLVLHLMLFQCEEEAKQLQSAFEALLVKAEEKVSTIWPPEGNVAMATPGSVQSVSSVHICVLDIRCKNVY